MITKEQAIQMMNEKKEQDKKQREEKIANFVENEVSPEIEKSAQNGATHLVIEVDSNYSHDITRYIEKNGFNVSLMGCGVTTQMTIKWS